jgi:hypothetical protein
MAREEDERAKRKKDKGRKDNESLSRRHLSDDDNSRNQMLKKGLAGAAVGVGSAILLHRTGAIKSLSDNLNVAHKFLKNDVGRTLKRHANYNLTIDDVRQASSELKQAWIKRRNEANGPLKINPYKSGGFAGVLSQTINAANNNDYAFKYFKSKDVIAPALNEYVTKYHNNGSNNKFNKFEKFINYVAENHKDQLHLTKAKTRLKIQNDDELNAANELIDFIQQRMENDALKKESIKEMRTAAKNSQDMLMHDLDYVAKRYGEESKNFGEKTQDFLYGDRAATIGDILDNKDKVDLGVLTLNKKNQNGRKTTGQKDFIEYLQEMQNEYEKQGQEALERFRNIKFDDGTTRISIDGELYSSQYAKEAKQDFIKFAAGTLPGKIFKMRSFEDNAPKFNFIAQGSHDPTFAAISNPNSLSNKNNGEIPKVVDSSYVRLGDDFFEITDVTKRKIKDSTGQEIEQDYALKYREDLEDLVAVSSRFGFQPRMTKYLAGDVGYSESSNPIKRWLDIGQDNEKQHNNSILSVFTKYNDPTYIENVLDELTDPSKGRQNKLATGYLLKDVIKQEKADSASYLTDYDRYIGRQYAVEYQEAIDRAQKYIRKNTYELGYETLNNLENNTTGTAKDIFKALNQYDNEELLQYVMQTSTKKTFVNKDLEAMISRFRNDPNNAYNMLYLKTDSSRLSLEGGALSNLVSPEYVNEGADFFSLLRTELGKEGFLQHVADNTKSGENTNWQSLLDLLDNVKTETKEDKNTKALSLFAMFQTKTKINENIGDDLEDVWSQIQSMDSIMSQSTSKEDIAFRDMFADMRNEVHNPLETRGEMDEDFASPMHYNTYTYQRKVATPLDLITNINDSVKLGRNFNTMFGQFTAGRDDMSNVTAVTQSLLFAGQRMSDALNTFDLGFSIDSTKSVFDLYSSFMTKRVMPVALGITYAEWLDDTVDAATGQSISGAMANGLANVDLAGRKVLDTFGLTQTLKDQMLINPIMQYWGDTFGGDYDKTNFDSYDERKKYYETGYTAMRKDPWWTFGGVQEARGSQIEYWAPTFNRRINSDYYDKSMYDGYFDKWSHSLVPTPINPISPLIGLLDPYWLEEKHSEDRPYPISGSMFQENTPWGAILNPTIGEIIKPQKELHDWRLRNGVDIKAALYALNESIKDKAKDLGAQNIIAIKGNDVQAMRFSAFNAPTEDTKVATYTYNPANNNGLNGPEELTQTYGVYEDTYNPVVNSDITAEALLSRNTDSFVDNSRTLIKSYLGLGPSLESPDGSGTVNGNLGYSDNGRLLSGEHIGNVTDSYGREKGVVAARNSKPLTLDQIKDVSQLDVGNELLAQSYIAMSGEASIDDEEDTYRDRFLGKLARKYNVKTLNILKQHNVDIKNKAKYGANGTFDEDQGILSAEKLSTFRPSQSMDLLNDPDMVSELINKGKGADFVKEATSSARLLGGIYGYMGSEAIGLGVYRDKELATSQDMTSYSRTFWDSRIGGFGGDIMEIARRFIPTYNRSNKLNPLMNNMPDWLPERFRFGDPYTAITNGEMRLPGKGWESLNEKHSDAYGDYGAFDRFKILADIAPGSAEYKLWRDIAKKTVYDPELIDEMDDIRKRVNQQGKKHDFYNYNLVGRGLVYDNVVVSEVLGYGKFRSGSTIYKVAGATVTTDGEHSMADTLGQYIHPGQTVTVAVDEDPSYRQNRDTSQSVNAAVYVDGENLAEQMIEMGDAKRKANDNSAPALLGRIGTAQQMVGWVSEKIAHLDLPWISDQFLRVRSPLEAYKAEEVYGNEYQSWSHPIDTMLLPAFERAIHENNFIKPLLREAFVNITNSPKSYSAMEKHLATVMFGLGDRGAFIGGALGGLVKIAGGNGNIVRNMMIGGSLLTSTAHFFTGGNSYADEMMSGAALGLRVAEFLDNKRGTNELISSAMNGTDIKDIVKKNKKLALGAAIGAGIGAIYRTLSGNAGHDWKPERTLKRWEMEDYFDRLTYLKYMGLYHAAAEKAKDEEGVDVEDLMDMQDKRKNAIQRAMASLNKLKTALKRSNRGVMNDEKNEIISDINKRLNILDEDTTIIKGGKWTHSAIIYKQAAESTMYGLDQNSSWSQIMSALPRQDKEFFMEFVKERNPDKRREILEFVSPALKKALSISWHMDKPDTESNEEFFKQHKLPSAKWEGWHPDINLDDVEMKVIQNEGMMLSDFGFYENQAREAKVINAPDIDYHSTDNTLSMRNNMRKILSGRGLKDVEINVTEVNNVSTTQIITDIKRYTGFEERQRMVNESLEEQTA